MKDMHDRIFSKYHILSQERDRILTLVSKNEWKKYFIYPISFTPSTHPNTTYFIYDLYIVLSSPKVILEVYSHDL